MIAKRDQFHFYSKLGMMAVVPLITTVLLNLRAFDSSFMPAHDAFGTFSCFAIYAKHLRQYGVLPLWLPYTAYGTPSGLVSAGLSPVNWLFILLSTIFRNTDLLWLFKLSLMGEQVLFGASCAWLASLLFRRIPVQLFFVIAAIMTCSVWQQHFFNLRMVVPLPWIIGLMLLAFRRKSRTLLFASAWPIPAAAYGLAYYCMVYFAILWLAAFYLCLLLYLKGGLGWLVTLPKRGQFVCEALLAILLFTTAGAVANFLLLTKNGQVAISPGRDLSTGVVLPSIYLSYGGVTDLATFVWSAALGCPDIAHNNEAYIFCGLPVVSVAVIGIYAARTRASRLILGLLLFSTAFSVAGFLTLLLYYWPLMDNFRHVGYTGVVVRFFLCVAAGFGMNSLLDSVSRKKMISSRFISDLPFVVALGFCFFISIPGIGLATPGYRFVLINLFIGLASGMIIWAAGRWIRGKLAGLVISSMMLIMLLVVARGLNQKISERDTWILSRPLAGAFACAINAPLRYVPIRGASNSVVDELVQGLSSRGELYDSMDSMLNHDQPLFTGHADVIPERTFRLIELSKASPDSYHAFAMDGLPKAYLADQPVKIFSKNIKAEPGDVYLETEKDLLRLKRKDDSKLEVEKFSFNQVTFDLPIEKDVKAPRFLVYEDSWHSEWTANAGGKAATVYPANLAFKAVEIAPGVNQVTFRFGSIQRYVLVYLNALLALSVLPAELMALIFLDRDPFLFVNPCKTPRE